MDGTHACGLLPALAWVDSRMDSRMDGWMDGRCVWWLHIHPPNARPLPACLPFPSKQPPTPTLTDPRQTQRLFGRNRQNRFRSFAADFGAEMSHGVASIASVRACMGAYGCVCGWVGMMGGGSSTWQDMAIKTRAKQPINQSPSHNRTKHPPPTNPPQKNRATLRLSPSPWAPPSLQWVRPSWPSSSSCCARRRASSPRACPTKRYKATRLHAVRCGGRNAQLKCTGMACMAAAVLLAHDGGG